MNNLPLGAKGDPSAPYNQPLEKECPRCGEPLTIDTQRVKIKGRWYEFTEENCEKCGWFDSNEPDFDLLND